MGCGASLDNRGDASNSRRLASSRDTDELYLARAEPQLHHSPEREEPTVATPQTLELYSSAERTRPRSPDKGARVEEPSPFRRTMEEMVYALRARFSSNDDDDDDSPRVNDKTSATPGQRPGADEDGAAGGGTSCDPQHALRITRWVDSIGVRSTSTCSPVTSPTAAHVHTAGMMMNNAVIATPAESLRGDE